MSEAVLAGTFSDVDIERGLDAKTSTRWLMAALPAKVSRPTSTLKSRPGTKLHTSVLVPVIGGALLSSSLHAVTSRLLAVVTHEGGRAALVADDRHLAPGRGGDDGRRARA